MRIGLAVVATGKYIRFVELLARSAREFLCPTHVVTLYVLTDGEIEDQRGAYVVELSWKHEPWPGPTIHRYRALLEYQWILERFNDYLFLCDADMRFVAPVGDEILGDLVGTIHPGFWNKPRSQFTYENRPNSTACIESGSGNRYYAGGFQGGSTARYLSACRELSERIDVDEANGITAVWHDESHWNRYLFEHPPTVELDPGYCYPESWNLPFERKVLALDKNHAAMRA